MVSRLCSACRRLPELKTRRSTSRCAGGRQRRGQRRRATRSRLSNGAGRDQLQTGPDGDLAIEPHGRCRAADGARGSSNGTARRVTRSTASQSYENLYTLNGAVINENLRGAPMTPYIEDAIQEVTVASSGVSAEYGRFSGGVANAITKSGGNAFSGSFRTSFANDSWRSLYAFRIDAAHLNPAVRNSSSTRPVPTYEATLRRPDVRADRLWFFSALRIAAAGIATHHRGDQYPYTSVQTTSNGTKASSLTRRASGHSVQGSYLQAESGSREQHSVNVTDLRSLTNQGQPQDLMSVQYTGVHPPELFADGAIFRAAALTFTDTGATQRI